jgi:hypothetical protein
VSIFYLQAAWLEGTCFSSQDRKNGQPKMFECGYKQSPIVISTMSLIRGQVNKVITVFDYGKDSIFIPSIIGVNVVLNMTNRVDLTMESV